MALNEFDQARLRQAAHLTAARDFTDEHLLPPAQDVDIRFMQDLGMYLPEPDAKETQANFDDLWDRAKDSRDELRKSLEAFQNKLLEDNPRVPRTDFNNCDWSQVITEVKKARPRYVGNRKVVSKCLDMISDNGDVLEQWIKALPSGDYGAVISGVFHMVVVAIGRTVEINEKVYSALEQIPSIMQDAQFYCGMYIKIKIRSHQMRSATVSLYIAILDALSSVVVHFEKHALRRALGSFFKGKQYGKDLTDDLNQIESKVEEVEKVSRQCQHEIVTRIFKIQAVHIELDSDTNRKTTEVLRKQQEMLDAYNVLYSLLVSAIRSLPAGGARVVDAQQQSSVMPSPRQGSPFMPVEGKGSLTTHITSLLQLEPTAYAKDVVANKTRGAVLDLEQVDKVSFIAASASFRTFLHPNTGSCKLLLNSDEDLSMLSGSIATSYLLAEVSHTYATAQSTIVLSFFCEEHSSRDSGVETMMTSLLTQLISHRIIQQHEPALFDIDEGNEAQALQQNKLKALCDIFIHLIDQVPEDTIVLCIVDSITKYESRARRKDTETVLKTLIDLASPSATNGHHSTFKFLVAASDISIFTKLFGKDVLDIPRNVDGSRHGIVDLRSLEGV